MLQKEFPLLKSYTLPAYNIKYPKNGAFLKWKLFFQLPSIISAIKKEQEIVAQLIKDENIKGIISDNRFGVCSAKIPSVYITHQLNVLSGFTTFITSKIHQKIAQKFTEIWIPDTTEQPNFSGKLSCFEASKKPIKHIGILSRFQAKKTPIKYDLLLLLSGIEPQRTLLENKLLVELNNFKGSILLVRGILSNNKLLAPTNFKVINYLLSKDLENAINQSELVIARSGYSTIMDLAALGKNAFFIPTPGQNEQEYLAKLMQNHQIAPYSKQQHFNLKKLEAVKNYNGFSKTKTEVALKLFNLFNGK